MTCTLRIEPVTPGDEPMARHRGAITAVVGTSGVSTDGVDVLASSTPFIVGADGTVEVSGLAQTSVSGDPIIYLVTVGRHQRHLDLSAVADGATVSWGDPSILVLEGPAPSDWVPVAGPGVPTGGSTGQVLAKASGTDYDTQWTAGGGGGAVDSVNGETGVVVLDADDVDAVPVTAVGLLAGERNRGEWSALTAYSAGDVVHDHAAESVFVATAASLDEQPSLTPAKWTAIDSTGREFAVGAGSHAGAYGLSIGAAASSGAYGLSIGAAASSGTAGLSIGTVATSGTAGLSIGTEAVAGADGFAIGSGAAAGVGGFAIGTSAAAGDYEVNVSGIYKGTVDTADLTIPTGASIATGFVDLPETVDATNPAADHQRLIARTDGLYVRDETGAEIGPLGGGGGGIPETIIDAAGDLIVGTADNTAGRLGVGTSGQVLTSNGTTATWAAPSGGGGHAVPLPSAISGARRIGASAGLALGTVYWMPMQALATAVKVTHLWVDLLTGQTGCAGTAAIVTLSASGYPGPVVASTAVDAINMTGTASASMTGAALSSAYTLAAGTPWAIAVIALGGTNPTARGCDGTDGWMNAHTGTAPVTPGINFLPAGLRLTSQTSIPSSPASPVAANVMPVLYASVEAP